MVEPTGSANQRVRRTVTHVVGLTFAIAPHHRLHIGLATGRFWAWGIDRGESTGIRLPVLALAVVHLRPAALVRGTYMGWRGIHSAPDPAFHEWRWPR